MFTKTDNYVILPIDTRINTCYHMSMETRWADRDEIESLDWPQLYSEDNDGDDFLVAEAEDGEIRAWAQVTGDTIYFIESLGGGAGTAIVDWMKARYGRVIADHTDAVSARYWEKQGFTRMPHRYCVGQWSNDYEWEEEE
jgi:hypothetical protein